MRLFFDLLCPPTLEGRVVNLILVVLWGLGVYCAAWNWLRVRREQAVVASVPAGSPEAEGDPPASPETLADLFDRLGLAARDPWQSPRTALGRRLRQLWQVRGVGRSGVEALAEVFSSREAMGLEVSRYLTSILVLLGLAGTIWGLHDLLGNLTRAAGQSSYGGLVQALQPMKTAFSCTFVGILTSVTLAGLLGYVERQQNEFVTRLEELVTVQVIPLIFPPSATRQLQRMQAILSRSGDFVREFGEAVGRGQELFSEKLTEAMTAASGAFASGLKEAGRGLEASLDSVASQARAAVGQLEESLGAMQEAGRALAESARSLLDYREELKRDRLELQALLRETNQSVLAIVERAVAPLERGGERIERAAEALSQVKEQLVGDSRQHEAMVAAFLQRAERSAEERRADIVAFSQEAERDRTLLAEETGRGLVAAQEIRQAIERAGSSHVEAALRFQELAAAVRPEDLRLPNGQVLGDRMAEIAVGLEAMAERLRITESARLPDRLDAVATTLDRVGAGLASLASHVTTEADTRAQLVNLQRNTLATLRDVQHRMNQPLWRLLLLNGAHAVGESA